MRKLIPAALLCIVFAGCHKNFIDKQASPASIKMEVAASSCEEEEFVCEFPIEAAFPGGRCAWQQFIRENLTYPAAAVDANIQGTVLVQFIVNTNGEIYNIEALGGPDELRQCAVDVVKKSPKWIPAIINGRNIKSYKKQPIIFRLEEE